MSQKKQEKARPEAATSPRAKNHLAKHLVCEQIEARFGTGENALRFWFPARNKGIDMLVTTADCRKAAWLKIKYSRSYEPRYPCNAMGWWDVERAELEQSPSAIWVFVCESHPAKGRKAQPGYSYVIIDSADLQTRLETTPNQPPDKYRLYLADISGTIIDTRGCETPDQIQALLRNKTPLRNYTSLQNNWSPLEKALLG